MPLGKSALSGLTGQKVPAGTVDAELIDTEASRLGHKMKLLPLSVNTKDIGIARTYMDAQTGQVMLISKNSVYPLEIDLNKFGTVWVKSQHAGDGVSFEIEPF